MINKVSDITYHDIADYIRVDTNDKNTIYELNNYLNIAKSFISSYTGIPLTGDGENLDSYPEFVIVVYVLCQDMHDNRSMYVDEKNLNKVVQIALGMHAKNNL